MNEFTVPLPSHRHVLSDFTSDDQRHSQSSKGQGVHDLCSQCTVTVCLATVYCILKGESRGTQSTEPVVQGSYLLLMQAHLLPYTQHCDDTESF